MITLEPITPQNAMLFKEVRLRALQDTPSAFGSTYAKESQLTDADWVKRAHWTGAKGTGYLAMDAGIPCGIAATFVDPDDVTRARLVSMWVAPAHRRLGIGFSLVRAILAWARAQHARTLELLVTCNNDPAIRFYERLGFTRTGRTEPYPNDPALIEYEMSRPIS
jgi:ribosomal protein S18 acetylase RimI-like enzyme